MLCYVTPKEHLGLPEPRRREARRDRLQNRRPLGRRRPQAQRRQDRDDASAEWATILCWPGRLRIALRVFLYSRFLYAFVFPVAAWDVFEEFTPHLAKLRRLAISRTITSLVLITLFGLALSAFLASGNDADDSTFLKTLAVFVWTGSAAASLSFLWVMHKEMRAQKLSPPRNTFVWLVFYELILLGEIVNCFLLQISGVFSPAGAEILTLALLTYGMSVTLWCAIKLRALPPEAPSEPANGRR